MWIVFGSGGCVCSFVVSSLWLLWLLDAVENTKRNGQFVLFLHGKNARCVEEDDDCTTRIKGRDSTAVEAMVVLILAVWFFDWPV